MGATREQVTEAMVDAASAKYREIGERCNWQHSWPSDEAFREILEAVPLSPSPTGGEAGAVADTWFTDRALPVMAMSADIESNRVLKLHFRRPVTDDDRKSLCDALNMHQASLTHPAPLMGEVEAVLRELLDCPDIADNDHKDEETHVAERKARALLTKLQGGWR